MSANPVGSRMAAGKIEGVIRHYSVLGPLQAFFPSPQARFLKFDLGGHHG